MSKPTLSSNETKQLIHLLHTTIDDRLEWLNSGRRIEEIDAEVICLEAEKAELQESMQHFYSKVSDYAIDLVMKKTGEK